MQQRPSKPKFIPPIKTAFSNIRGISKSPEVITPHKRPSIVKDFVPEFLVSHLKFSTKDSDLLTNNHLSQEFRKKQKDMQDLQIILKSSSESELKSYQNLPLSPNHLKSIISATDRMPNRAKSPKASFCLKEKCIEHVDRQDDYKFVSFEESHGINTDLGPLTDFSKLKEWHQQMKTRNLSKILKEPSAYKKLTPNELEAQTNILEIVLRVGISEFIRQISIQSSEKAEFLNEFFNYQKIFWKSKLLTSKNGLEKTVEGLKQNIVSIIKENDKKKAEYKEKEDNVNII